MVVDGTGVALITDPFFYAVAIPALLIVGISKGGFGGGLGMVGVPLMALAIPLVQAAAILLPVLCVMDLFALRAFWGRFSRRNVVQLLPAAAVGIALGTWAFDALPEAWIRGIVGAIAIAFAGRYWLSLWRDGGVERPPAERGPTSAAVWGTITGFTSTMAHAGGPPLAVHLLPQRLDRTVYVGTTVVLFTAINLIKLPPYAWLGQLDFQNLATSAVLSPLAPVGIAIGRWLHDRIDDAPFYRIAYAVLVVVGLKLVGDAFAGGGV